MRLKPWQRQCGQWCITTENSAAVWLWRTTDPMSPAQRMGHGHWLQETGAIPQWCGSPLAKFWCCKESPWLMLRGFGARTQGSVHEMCRLLLLGVCLRHAMWTAWDTVTFLKQWCLRLLQSTANKMLAAKRKVTSNARLQICLPT